jgi:hypothetical protein
MPANRIGIRRAIIERAYRRGYADAAADLIAALRGGIVMRRTMGRLEHWQREIDNWRKAVNVVSEPGVADQRPPRPNLKRPGQTPFTQ